MTSTTQENALIDSIKKQAQEETRKILEDAQRFVEERKKSTEVQIAGLKKDTEERAKQQVNAIEQDGLRKIATLERKHLLALKNEIVEHVLTRVREKFDEQVSRPEFRETLIDWTVEAALGLAAPDPILRVTASCAHWIDDDFLDKAARRYRELTGDEIAFTRAPETIPKGCGIILEAKNGRTAYNNLVQNRLDRYRERIEAIVLKDVFHE